MDGISGNIKKIKEEIRVACQKTGRDPATVKLLAVSKFFPVAVIQEAFAAGQQAFGENKVQEILQKAPQLPAEIEWHMIGTLQRNKVKQVLGKTALIHSLDSLVLAEELSKRAVQTGLSVSVLLQVNIAEENTKSGFHLRELLATFPEIARLPELKIKGLMTMAPFVTDPEEVRPIFRQLKMLAQRLESLGLPGVEMKELSMGMNGDFQVAVEEGATIVRIGSRIFGTRNYKGGE